MSRHQAEKLQFAAASRRRTVGRTLFWFALLNLVAVEYLFGSLKDLDYLLGRVNLFQQTVHPNNSSKSDLPTQPQFQRKTASVVEDDANDGQKGGLNVTRVPISPLVEFPKPAEAQSVLDADNIQASVSGTPDGFNPAESLVKEENANEPVLRKDPTTGTISIGAYKSLTLSGRQNSCIDLGRSMLTDIGAPADKLSVVMSTFQIAIVKICANNGSVVITCRGGKIVVSPRRVRPDDNCSRAG